MTEQEDKVERDTQVQQLQEKRLKKYGDSLRGLQDNMKCNNIQIIGIPEGEENEQVIETLFEKIMRKTFQTWRREKTCKFRKHRVPIKMKPKRPTPKNIIIKMPSFKDKERILKAAREKSEVTYKGALIRLTTDFSTDTL